MKETTKSKMSRFINKVKPLFFPTLYFALVVTLSFSLFSVFKKRNFISIYIDGESMRPTLNADSSTSVDGKTNAVIEKNIQFGYANSSKQAINSLKHFDIVITYYNDCYNIDANGKEVLKQDADYKIKRVIALPGETFKIVNSVISYKIDGEWVSPDLPFSRNISSITKKDHPEHTLNENEYWVLGDNCANSRDSQDVGVIKKMYIAGVLSAIEGTCTLEKQIVSGKTVSKLYDYKYYKNPIYFL